MAQNQAIFTVEDYDGETARTSINIGPITAVNFTAKRAAIDAVKAALVAGAQPFILGELRKTNITESFSESADNVTNVYARRETKWLVTFRDNTQYFDVGNTISNPGFGETFNMEYPTGNPNLTVAGGELLDETVTEVQNLITAWEAVVNSPTGGNECLFVRAKLVGRNL